MKHKLLSFVFVIALQTMTFAQTNPLLKYLPENVSAIMNFDMIRLVSKIPGETFRQSFIYREMMKDPKMPFNTLFSAPQKMGIDFSTGLILTVSISGEGDYTDPIVSLFAKLSSADAFTSSMKEMLKGGDTAIKVYGTNRILIPGEAGPAMAWNNEIVVFNISQSKQAGKEINELYGDTTLIDIDKSVAAVREKYKKLQREEIFNLLTPHPQNSFSTNSILLSLLQTPGDIKMWSSGGGNPMMGNKFPFADLLKKLQSFTGHNRTSVINFEKGKIVTQTHSYLNKEMADVYKKYPVSPINTDLIKRLPEGKILALMTSSYNPEMGREFLAKSGFKEIIDSVKNKVPFDIDLLQNAFKNNAIFAVIKGDADEADPATKKFGGIQLIIAMPIGDKAAFEKLKSAALQFWEKARSEEKTEKIFREFTPTVKYNDEVLVLSLSPTTATSFLNNTGTGAVPDWVQEHTSYPMVMGIEFSEIIKMLMGMKPKGRQDDGADKIASMFDKMVIYGGNFENETLNSTMEFRFSNPNDNALKQLLEIMNNVAEEKGGSPMGNNSRDSNMDKVTIQDVKITAIEEDPGPPPAKQKPKTPVKKKN